MSQIAADHGKIPPQALDLEGAVLGAIMLERDAILSVIDILKPECFYQEAHQKRTRFVRVNPAALDNSVIELGLFDDASFTAWNAASRPGPWRPGCSAPPPPS